MGVTSAHRFEFWIEKTACAFSASVLAIEVGF